MKSIKDNNLLVEFDFLIDLDMALFKLIREEYNNTNLVDQNIIKINDEKQIAKLMINRKHINPLEIIIPKIDTTDLYLDLIENHMDEILRHAKAYDTFGLMITLLKEASSVDITVLCQTELQKQFINKLNPILNTIVIKNRADVPLARYTALYLKYYANALEYKNLAGKHIYVSAAGFNMEEDKNMLSYAISVMVADVNIIHTIDLYREVKYNYERKNLENE